MTVTPHLIQTHRLVGVDALHELGITGVGIDIYVIDEFPGHGLAVRSVLRETAPGASLHQTPVEFDLFIWPKSVRLLDALAESPLLRPTIVSMSWGSDSTWESPCHFDVLGFRGAAQRAVAAGITLISSAGNDGQTGRMSYPACLPEVIAVAATWDYTGDSSSCGAPVTVDELTCWTNRADGILAAPGGKIDVKWWSGLLGTSLSAPVVAGVLALLDEITPLSPARANGLLRDSGVQKTKDGINYVRVDAIRAALLLLWEEELTDSDLYKELWNP